MISKIKSDIDDLIDYSIKEFGEADVIRLRALIKNPPQKKTAGRNECLIQLFEEYIAVTGQGKRSKVHTLKSHLEKFIGDDFIRPIDLDYQFLNLFEIHLRKTNRENSTKKMFEDLRSFFNYLTKHKGIPSNQAVKDKKVKGTEPFFVVLTENQLNNLYRHEVESELEGKIRDIFLILNYTGLAWVDYFKGDFNLIQRRIRGRRSKSGTPFNVPLHNNVIDIFEKYDGQKPLVCQQVFNREVKKVLAKIPSFQFDKSKNGKKIPFYNLVSSHTGRHTFIDLGLRKSWPIQTMMSYVGHSSAKQLLEYAKKHLATDNDFELINQL